MNSIQKQNTEIAIFQPSSKAVEVRRQMLDSPHLESLTRIDKSVFLASTKTSISDIDDATLVNRTSQLFRFIAKDVGYRIPTDSNDWAYNCTRILDFIKKYYSNLSLDEIKLAFELSVFGELDEFLPKDAKGQPDNKHYQEFNIDYFSKILRAYKSKQSISISKAYKALPEPKKEPPREYLTALENNTKYDLVMSYLFYKYHRKYPEVSFLAEMLFSEILIKVGLIDSIQIIDSDLNEAKKIVMSRISAGFINKFLGNMILKQGIEHDEIKNCAYVVARKREIISCFDEIISEEINIFNFIKFER